MEDGSVSLLEAVVRLRAIVAKLRLLPATDEITKATHEFQSVIDGFEDQEKENTLYGCIAVSIVTLVVIALILIAVLHQ